MRKTTEEREEAKQRKERNQGTSILGRSTDKNRQNDSSSHQSSRFHAAKSSKSKKKGK